jgi:hypothetical protein
MHATDISIVLWLMSFHYVADFIVQTDWQARNKWTNPHALMHHVLSYSVVMAVGAAFLNLSFDHWFAWVLMTGLLHWFTDWATSRVSHHFFSRNDFHNGFVVVGFDQLIHLTCLLGVTYGLQS